MRRSTLVWLVFAFLCPCFAQTANDTFSLVLLPDPQNYSQYYPANFKAQTQWIVNNAAALNIKFVLGEGDLVNHPDSTTEWQNADAAVKILDNANIPYAWAIGNHDYDGLAPVKRSAHVFNQYFGPARYQSHAWYKGNYGGSNENFYSTFSAGGRNYLVLALEFHPRDSALAWAEQILDANEDKTAIIVTHAFEFNDNRREDVCDTQDVSPANGNPGQAVWTKMIATRSNVSLVVNGHLTSGDSAHRSDLTQTGALVNQIFTNYQTWTQGGDGWLKIVTITPSLNTVKVQTYSPITKTYMTDSARQYTMQYAYDGNPPGATNVVGRVFGPNCAKVSGATVSIGSTKTTTDSNGRYTIAAPAGAVTVKVSASGYNSASATANVNAGFSAQQEFYLTTGPTPTPTPTPSPSPTPTPVPSPTPTPTPTGPGAPCPMNPASPSVTICTPANSATVSSPVHVVAGTTDSKSIKFLQIYIDGKIAYTVNSSALDTSLALAAGTHRLTVQATDTAGTVFKTTINITVSTVTPTPTPTPSPSPTPSPTPTPTPSPTPNPTPSPTPTPSPSPTPTPSPTPSPTPDPSPSPTPTPSPTPSPTPTPDPSPSPTPTPTPTGPGAPCPMNPASPSVTICTPADSATVSSPVHVVAGTTDSKSIKFLQIYIDGKVAYTVSAPTLDTTLTLTAGPHRLTVQATDTAGTVFKATENITGQ